MLAYIPMRWIERSTEYLLYLFFASLIFSNTLSQGISIIIIVLWLIRWIISRKFVHSPLDFAVIAFLFVRGASCFLSVDPFVSLHELRSGIFFCLIYFAITHQIQKEGGEKRIFRYLAILIYAGAIAAVYGIGYVLMHQLAVRAQSTAGGISRFSEFTMIVFCLAFVLSNERRIFPARWISYTVITVLAVGLIAAKARTQWIAVVPVVLIVGLKRERWLLGIVSGIAAVLFASIRSLRERFMIIVDPSSAIPGRLLIWRGALRVFFERPFRGFGPRTYGIVSPYLRERGSWHCDYLQVYLDSGIFGFLSYCYLSFMLFRYSIRLVRTPAQRNLGWGFLLTFSAMYIVSLVGGHIQEPVITPLFFSLIGFVSVLGRDKLNCGVRPVTSWGQTPENELRGQAPL